MIVRITQEEYWDIDIPKSIKGKNKAIAYARQKWEDEDCSLYQLDNCFVDFKVVDDEE